MLSLPSRQTVSQRFEDETIRALMPHLPSEWPWLRDLYRLGEQAPRAWVMKSAQVGISEWLVCTALWAADTRLGGRGNALYVFPTQVTMDDFAQARGDKAIEDRSEER